MCVSERDVHESKKGTSRSQRERVCAGLDWEKKKHSKEE